MQKIILLLLLITTFLLGSETHAYRIEATSWGADWAYDADGWWRYHRMYNASGIPIFVPGKDNAGVVNNANFYTISWYKQRPWSIRIHTIVPVWIGITQCPWAQLPDSNINYWGTSNGNQAVWWATTVLANGYWEHRSPLDWVWWFDGELRCDFWATY